MKITLIYQTLKRLALILLVSFSLPVLSQEGSASGDATVMVAEEAAVNLNTATAEELADALQQIGLTKAKAIVAWREANGPFTSLEQLVEVKGIGAKTLAVNRALLRLE